jgi:hypothetical protein
MKATVESTNAIVEMRDPQGRPFTARVWRGVSERGVEFTAYIAIAQIKNELDQFEFARDLTASAAPPESTQHAIDMRFII